MGRFLSRYGSQVTGVLSGFDRLVFHGTLQRLMRTFGMYYFLKESNVQLLDFKQYALTTTDRIKRAAVEEAARLNRPAQYLASGKERKDELARKVLETHPVDQGLICLFSTLEPCRTFSYVRSQDRLERGLKPTSSKCLHLYKYFIHPVFGFMSARLQTWFPFNIQICMNGREWLARQLLSQGYDSFSRVGNCFPWIKDFAVAQQLMKEQLTTNWPTVLTEIARMINPLHEEIFRDSPTEYYWSAFQTEWATDLTFRSPAALANVFPPLVRFAMLHLKSHDVMRFLSDKAPGNFTGQIVTSFKHRAEGVRVKHWLRGNSIKMYDKAGNVLRIETTIGETTDLKVFRPKQAGSPDDLQWLPLRKGVADLHRRAEVSGRSNTRYLDALATSQDTTPCFKIFDVVSRPVVDGKGRRVRALRLSDPDELKLLQAISRGEFAISGFRNRDIRRQLHGPDTSPEETRRLAAKTGRLLRILKAHGLLVKTPKTTRYRLSPLGHLLTSALFATRNADIHTLLKSAA